MNKSNTARRVAGILYLVYFALELFLFKPLYLSYSLMAVPVFVNALLIAGAGAGAVWILAGTGMASKTAGRAVAVTTGLVVVKSLVLYEIENELLAASLYEVLPSLAGDNVWNYVFVIVRLMLLIVAAFFVLTAGEEPAALGEDADGEDGASFADEERAAEGSVVEVAAPAEEKKGTLADSEGNGSLPGNDR